MQYTSCFIAIPIPAALDADLQKAVKSVSGEFPNAVIADVRTPHITLYYLDKQSQLALPEIEAQVRKRANMLVGSTITIGAMGLFGGEQPRVLYLQAECSEEIYAFQRQISSGLTTYHAPDNDHGFVPHITLARIKPSDAKSFKDHNYTISDALDSVKASFEVKELCIYGVDSRITPERQTKITTIAV
jgi:2'-5' RNA ligase